MNLAKRIKSALKHLAVPLQLKEMSLGEDGTFSGYASIWGEKDSYDEVVRKGAFAGSLRKWAADGKMPKMLWQHDARQPIGVWTSMVEDAKGLRVEGRLSLDTDKGKETYALLKMGAIDGLSIGYVATKWEVDEKKGITYLTEIDLWEVSVVTFPAGPSARVDGVKSALKDGKLPSLSDFEGFLREAGFSKSQAAAIAGKGLASLLRQREAGSVVTRDTLDDLLSVIRN